MTVFIDIFYMLAVVMNFIMLKIHSIFLSVRVSVPKLILGALSGGLLSIKSFVFGSGYVTDILATLLILRMIYGKSSFLELIKRFFIFLSIVLMYAAIMNAFTAMCSGVFLKDGRMYAVFPGFVFTLGAVLGFFVILTSAFFMKHKRNLYNVEIKTDKEVIKTKAFLDTGNGLLEPKSGKPVIIIEDSLIKENHERESIFLKTAVSDKEQLDMIKVESVVLLEENRIFYDLYAGISGQSLSKNGEFHALLNSKFAI